MGEAADMMLEGLLCQFCGELIDGEEPGYPRCCSGCNTSDDDDIEFVPRAPQKLTNPNAPKTWGCTGCKRLFRKKKDAIAHCAATAHAGEPLDTTQKVKPCAT